MTGTASGWPGTSGPGAGPAVTSSRSGTKASTRNSARPIGGAAGSASTSSVQTPAGAPLGSGIGQSTAAPGCRAGTCSAKTLPFGRRTLQPRRDIERRAAAIAQQHRGLHRLAGPVDPAVEPGEGVQRPRMRRAGGAAVRQVEGARRRGRARPDRRRASHAAPLVPSAPGRAAGGRRSGRCRRARSPPRPGCRWRSPAAAPAPRPAAARRPMPRACTASPCGPRQAVSPRSVTITGSAAAPPRVPSAGRAIRA